MKDFNPQNILVINFGQLGDVILSFPALKAIRDEFPTAKITVAIGKSCAAILDLSGFADEKIIVDRVKLRDSPKIWSIFQIGKLISDVRRREFDFVIDLHSLPETNLLSVVSGAGKRLLANRESRSLNFLSSFRTTREDRSQHATDRYLKTLESLGIKNVPRVARITPRKEDLQIIEKRWRKHRIEGLTVGLFPGAGHESRRWDLDKFATLAEFLTRNERVRIVVFLGPEEKNLTAEVRRKFPAQTVIFDDLTLPQLVAALAQLSVFVSNDTGPMHLAALVGASVVLLMDKNAPTTYTPLTNNLRVLNKDSISDLSVKTVHIATQELLSSSRVETLFTL